MFLKGFFVIIAKTWHYTWWEVGFCWRCIIITVKNCHTRPAAQPLAYSPVFMLIWFFGAFCVTILVHCVSTTATIYIVSSMRGFRWAGVAGQDRAGYSDISWNIFYGVFVRNRRDEWQNNAWSSFSAVVNFQSYIITFTWQSYIITFTWQCVSLCRCCWQIKRRWNRRIIKSARFGRW